VEIGQSSKFRARMGVFKGNKAVKIEEVIP